MLLPQIGCTFQGARPRHHRILVTTTALIKRKTRHSSSCFGVERHFKLLWACANVAITWHCHGYEVSSFPGFPPGNEASRAPERRFSPRGSRLLRLFTPQVTEGTRIHLSSLLAEATWSCRSPEKISDQKKIHRNKTKKHFLKNVKRCRDHYAKKHSNKV